MRSSLRIVAAIAAAISVAACSDSSNNPSAPTTRTPPSLSAPLAGLGASATWAGFASGDFTLTSNGGTFVISGLYTLTFPANSVCDPDQSSYGPTEWDSPCQTLADGQSIKVHGSISLIAGGLGVDFNVPLRFSPDTRVTLSTSVFASVLKSNQDYFSSNTSALNFLAIYYAPAIGQDPVPDYLTDPDVITHVDLTTGRVWRRIKHFSGYVVGAKSATCDSNCVQVDGLITTPDPINP